MHLIRIPFQYGHLSVRGFGRHRDGHRFGDRRRANRMTAVAHVHALTVVDQKVRLNGQTAAYLVLIKALVQVLARVVH